MSMKEPAGDGTHRGTVTLPLGGGGAPLPLQADRRGPPPFMAAEVTDEFKAAPSEAPRPTRCSRPFKANSCRSVSSAQSELRRRKEVGP